VREYIKAALSPAKISEIKLDRDKNKAEVIVDDDQLSLSIGKHGQNVRLASRLVGWELDIRTKSMIASVALGEKTERKADLSLETEVHPEQIKVKKGKKSIRKEAKKAVKKETKKEGISLKDLSGVGAKLIESLKEAGIKSIDDIIKAKLEGLVKIKGIGEKKAQKIITEAKKLL
jgi:N utilization substance protein A